MLRKTVCRCLPQGDMALHQQIQGRKKCGTPHLDTETIQQKPLVLEECNKRLWVGLLEKATVFHDGRTVFQFKNGTEIEVEL